ncbi:MAG: hypothetical protein AB9844_06505 [Clostridiaceae bacterium]
MGKIPYTYLFGAYDEFNEGLWCSTLNHMIIKSEKEALFKFKDGTELPWSLK